MITHTRPAVEAAPTLADYPTDTLKRLADQAATALATGNARLGLVHCSPATLRDIRDNVLAEIQARETRHHAYLQQVAWYQSGLTRS
jgi:hypothetical protein